jgi:hypothetical protein
MGNLEVIEALLSNGADINAVNNVKFYISCFVSYYCALFVCIA